MKRTDRLPLPRRIALVLLGGLMAVSAGCNAIGGRASNQLGQAYYRQGNYMAARQEFHRAASLEPWNASYRYNLAAAMQKQGDAIGAEQQYRTALNVDPGHQPTYHGLALLLNQQGRSVQAQELLTSWAATQPYRPEAHVEVAWIQREQGNLAGAEQSLQRAIALRPQHPVALAHLGQLYQQTGQTQRAVAMYQNSLRSKWNQPQVHSRLASLRHSTTPAPQMAYAGGQSMHNRQWTSVSPWTQQGPVVASVPSTYRYSATPHRTYMASTPAVTTRVLPASPSVNVPMTAGVPYYNADPAHVPPATAFFPVRRAW